SHQMPSDFVTPKGFCFPFHLRKKESLQFHDAVDLFNNALALVSFEGDRLGDEDAAVREVSVQCSLQGFAALVGIRLGKKSEELLSDLLQLFASLANLLDFVGLLTSPLLSFLLPLQIDPGKSVPYVYQ